MSALRSTAEKDLGEALEAAGWRGAHTTALALVREPEAKNRAFYVAVIRDMRITSSNREACDRAIAMIEALDVGEMS